MLVALLPIVNNDGANGAGPGREALLPAVGQIMPWPASAVEQVPNRERYRSMIRHVLAVPLFLAMIAVMAARADDNDKETPKSAERDEAAIRQERLKDQFGDFKSALQRLITRL